MDLRDFQLPIGAVQPFLGTALPRGWEWCDGEQVCTQWSPLFGQKKPPMPNYIIRVASETSVLDHFIESVEQDE